MSKKTPKKNQPIIMIVDDTYDNLNLLSEALKDCGYSIRPSLNGKLALAAVKEEKPDLILLDIMMPEMNGFEVCSILKSDMNTKDIPIIFLTAMGRQEDEVKGLSIGAVDYITKPLNIPLVKARVNTHLQLKFHQDHLEKLVKVRTEELNQTNENLHLEIKERKKAELMIIKSRNFYLTLFEEMPTLIWRSGVDLRFNFFNKSWLNFTGHNLEDEIKSGLGKSIHPNEFDLFMETYTYAFKKQISFSIKVKLICNDGQYHWVMIYGRPFKNPDGKFAGFIGSCFDINEIEFAYEKIRKSLVEKDSLLKEIHHRVKNNLQIISSLLYFEEEQIKDEELLIRFENYRTRIKSMAMVHDNIYHSEKLSEVDFKKYIFDLSKSLLSSYDDYSKNIIFDLDIEQIYLDLSISIPLGLILNEFLLNSFKYSFPDGNKGKITISLKKENGIRYYLSVRDEGIINYQNFNTDISRSLSLKMIEILLEQINGEMKFDFSDRTKISIGFNILDLGV